MIIGIRDGGDVWGLGRRMCGVGCRVQGAWDYGLGCRFTTGVFLSMKLFTLLHTGERDRADGRMRGRRV